MSVRCFVVTKVAHRQVTIPERPCTCDTPGCTWVFPERQEIHFDVERADTGEVVARDRFAMGGFPPGAMWWETYVASETRPSSPDDWSGLGRGAVESARDSFAKHPEWYPQGAGADPTLPKRSPTFIFATGPCLMVTLPNGHDWNVDSRARNCTMPYDYAHRCWVKHGTPPNVTADKTGLTCQAGGGSILSGDYHGFLQNGELT